MEQDRNDLLAGTGRWTNTPAGEAARAYDAAEAQLKEIRRAASSPTLRRRERRAATKALPGLENAFNEATAQWTQVGQPEADRLWAETEQARQDHTRFDREVQRERLDLIQNSDPARNLPDGGFGIG